MKERGGRVVFECQAALAKLLATCPGIDVLVPAFDVQTPLMSLPYLFGTTRESIPAAVPYLFADEGLLGVWGQVLSRLGDAGRSREPSGTEAEESGSARRTYPESGSARRTYVGIAWQGNPRFKRDRQRSIPLRQFAPLARVPGVRLISLQRGAGTEQLASAGFEVFDLGRNDAFTDTGAIMRNLDLVITSDTSIAHLAGALGVPVSSLHRSKRTAITFPLTPWVWRTRNATKQVSR